MKNNLVFPFVSQHFCISICHVLFLYIMFCKPPTFSAVYLLHRGLTAVGVEGALIP